MKINIKDSVFIFTVQIGFCIKVKESLLRLRKEINLTINTAKPPHILILKISRSRITVYLCANCIFSVIKILCNIKLMRSHGTSRISYIFTVYPYLKSSLTGTEMKKNISAVPILINCKLTTVNTDFLHCMVDARNFHS